VGRLVEYLKEIAPEGGSLGLAKTIEGRYVSKSLRRIYDTFPLYTPLMQVSFGVDRDMRGEPRLTTYGFDPTIRIGSSKVPFLLLNNYAFDATMAPPGSF
jgi:hypothetical protein